MAFDIRSNGDGRLAAAGAGRDFSFRLSADGQTMDIELDAGTSATYHRVAPDAPLPADLPGTYRSAEMAATWTITANSAAMDLTIAGPLANAGPWPLEGIQGDIIRVWTPGTLYRGWLDARLVRDDAGTVTGLLVNGNRVKNLSFQKVTA